jgi:hydrogenase maturation protease
MRALLIAVGNRLRRDDGVAHTVLEQLVPISDVASRAFLQLTPEVTEEIAGYDIVIFIDSDANAVELSIEPMGQLPSSPVFSHIWRPAEIVQLSTALFGFTGRAFLCRIPVCELSPGEGLSRQASAFAKQAAGRVEALLSELRIEAPF